MKPERKHCTKCKNIYRVEKDKCNCNAEEVTDIQLLKTFYKEGDLPVEVSKKIARAGFKIATSTTLVKLKKLGYKTGHEKCLERTEKAKQFIKSCFGRPTANFIAKKFEIGKSNASSIIVDVLGYKTRYDNSNRSNRTTQAEKEYLSKLLSEYQEFEANRVWPTPHNIVMHAPLLRKHGMI